MKGMQAIKRGSGFGGVLDYALEAEEGIPRGKVVGGNMDGHDQKSLAKEFGISRRIRSDVEKPVWHNSLRLPAGEKLTEDQWAKIGDDYMKRMGFSDEHQRVYILHDEPEGQHIHIIASRISLDNKLYLGKNENLKSTKVIQRLEKAYGLTITKGPEYQDGKVVMPDTKRPTDGELGVHQRTGDQPPRYKLIELIDKAIEGNPTAIQFVERLQAADVTVKPNMGKEKLNGFSFEIDGVPFKGSQLGNQYKGQSLFDRGMTYEQSRDHEALKRLTRPAANDTVDPAAPGGAEQLGRAQIEGDDRGAEPVGAGASRADQAVIEASPGALSRRDSEVDQPTEAGIRLDDARVDDSANAAIGRDAGRADSERDSADLPVDNDDDSSVRGIGQASVEADQDDRSLTEDVEHSADSGDRVDESESAEPGASPSAEPGANADDEVPSSGPVSGGSDSVAPGGGGGGGDDSGVSYFTTGNPVTDQMIRESEAKMKAAEKKRSALAAMASAELYKAMKKKTATFMESASSFYRDLLVDLNSYRLPIKGDRNESAVRRMLNGLGSGDFEVRIIDNTKQKKAQSRKYSAEQLADPKTLGFLRSKNAQGMDIYVRPRHPDKSGLVLVDDLNQSQIAELELAGLKPAVVLQTSDQNFQAWIRINSAGFGREEHAGIAKFIRKEVGGDPASTDQEHFGRLVGFTNKKPERMNGLGQSPYVKLESHDGRQAINGEMLLDAVRQDIEARLKRERDAKLDADAQRLVESQIGLDVGDIRFGQLKRGWLKEKWNVVERSMIKNGVMPDASRIDFRVAMQMRNLKVPIAEAIEAFEREMPSGDRKVDLTDYAVRTVAKAYTTVEMKAEGYDTSTIDILAEAKNRYPAAFEKKVHEKPVDQRQPEPVSPSKKTISQILEADKKPKRGVDFEM